MNKILTAAIGLSIIIGGWSLLKDNTPPLTSLPASEASSTKVTATLNPEQPVVGESTVINFTFTNSDGTPVGDLMAHHARRVHVLLISEDLTSIGHIHPSDFGDVTDAVVQSGNYSVNYTFPKAGRYIVGVDVMNMEDKLAQQFIVNVKGDGKMNKVASDLRREKCFRGYQEAGHDRYTNPVSTSESEVQCPEGYKVTMTPSVETITAGEEVQLQYRVEKAGEPVTDLEPYLNAAIHFAIVPQSFDRLLHMHGFSDDREGSMMEEMHGEKHHGEEMHEEEGSHAHRGHLPDAFGPKLVSETMTFPSAGLYQIFAQVKHEGSIIFSNFMIEVEEGFDAASAEVINLEIANRVLTPQILTLTEGDKVILRVQTDGAGEFHVAGYEIEKEMTVGEVTEIRFTANLPGRYNLELHPEGTDEDLEIGALVVNPR